MFSSRCHLFDVLSSIFFFRSQNEHQSSWILQSTFHSIWIVLSNGTTLYSPFDHALPQTIQDQHSQPTTTTVSSPECKYNREYDRGKPQQRGTIGHNDTLVVRMFLNSCRISFNYLNTFGGFRVSDTYHMMKPSLDSITWPSHHVIGVTEKTAGFRK